MLKKSGWIFRKFLYKIENRDPGVNIRVAKIWAEDPGDEDLIVEDTGESVD